MEGYYTWLLTAALGLLGLGLVLALIRAIRGPRPADRILGVNLVGSLSTASIAVLAVLLRQSWLLDVGLIYCMMSFLAVVVLARGRIRAHREGEDENV
jgi:multicomponent Na+:H+ antiporter subunit F